MGRVRKSRPIPASFFIIPKKKLSQRDEGTCLHTHASHPAVGERKSSRCKDIQCPESSLNVAEPSPYPGEGLYLPEPVSPSVNLIG